MLSKEGNSKAGSMRREREMTEQEQERPSRVEDGKSGWRRESKEASLTVKTFVKVLLLWESP